MIQDELGKERGRATERWREEKRERERGREEGREGAWGILDVNSHKHRGLNSTLIGMEIVPEGY